MNFVLFVDETTYVATGRRWTQRPMNLSLELEPITRKVGKTALYWPETARIDPEEKTLQPLHGLFRANVLPMS